MTEYNADETNAVQLAQIPRPVKYDTSNNNGTIGTNSSREISIDVGQHETNIVLVRVIPGASTDTNVEIYTDSAFNAEDRIYKATGVSANDTLSDRLNAPGLGYHEQAGNDQIHVKLVNNDGTNASNYDIVLWII